MNNVKTIIDKEKYKFKSWTSILKNNYKFQNKVGIDKSTETRNDGITA